MASISPKRFYLASNNAPKRLHHLCKFADIGLKKIDIITLYTKHDIYKVKLSRRFQLSQKSWFSKRTKFEIR